MSFARRPRWALAAALLSTSACDRSGAGGTASASSTPAPAPTVLPSPSAPRASSSSADAFEDETSTRPMELLKFQFTSAVKGREPVDDLKSAKPGQRVYAYFTVRNRTKRKRTIHVAFKVNGQKRTEVDLDIDESWSFRTWAYNTVLPKDGKGKLELDVVDDEGNGLVEASLPIVP